MQYELDEDECPMGRVIATAFFGLLAVPATLFAFASFLLLDAPWAAHGLGAVFIWLLIADFWILAWALGVAAKATWTRRWPFYRAALLPVSAVVAHFVLVGVAYITLHRCILWCSDF
jgi:hypothetical protein